MKQRKSFFDYSDKEKKQIIEKAAKESNRAQKEFMKTPNKLPSGNWEKEFELCFGGELFLGMPGEKTIDKKALKAFIKSEKQTSFLEGQRELRGKLKKMKRKLAYGQHDAIPVPTDKVASVWGGGYNNAIDDVLALEGGEV